MPESSQVTEQVVAGRYRLLERIGRGGMGTVWRARDEVLGRDVAVKEVIAPPELTEPEREVFASRTFREARAAGRVSHPSVATVYDAFEENGHPWLVMQLVPSDTVGAYVRDHGPLPPARVARIGLEVLSALRAAHRAGVLHRDVKPDNVLLTKGSGRAVLTDFGIATLEDDSPVTRTGMLVGTPAFIAPERASGGQATRASDLWSLGVTLYVAVEGRSPFHRGNPLATLGAVMHDPPEPMRLAGPLGPVLDGLLHKDPAGRLSAADAEAYLRMVAEGLAPEPTAPAVPAQRRGPAVAASAAAPTPPVPREAQAQEGPRHGPFAVGAIPVTGDVRPTRESPARGAGGNGRGMALAGLGALVLSVGLVTGGAAWMMARMDDRQTTPAVSPTVRVTVSVTPTPPPATAGRGDRPSYSQVPPVVPSSKRTGGGEDTTRDQDQADKGPKDDKTPKDKGPKDDEGQGDKPSGPPKSKSPKPENSGGAGEIPPGHAEQGSPRHGGPKGGNEGNAGGGARAPLHSVNAGNEASMPLMGHDA